MRILQASDTAITLLAETPGMQFQQPELAGTQYAVLACRAAAISSQWALPTCPSCAGGGNSAGRNGKHRAD